MMDSMGSCLQLEVLIQSLSKKTDEKRARKHSVRSPQKETVALVFSVLHPLRNIDRETVPQSYEPVLTDHSRTTLNKLFMMYNTVRMERFIL